MDVLYVFVTVIFILLFYGEMKKNAEIFIKDVILGVVSLIALMIRTVKRFMPW